MAVYRFVIINVAVTQLIISYGLINLSIKVGKNTYQIQLEFFKSLMYVNLLILCLNID